MRVEEVATSAISDLLDELNAIRHDLGKYMVFETRFVGMDAAEADLRRALMADLQATRRRRLPDETESVETAWDVWRRLRPQGLDDDPDVVDIDRGIEQLRTSDLNGDTAQLRRTAELALQVSAATRRLSDRARAALVRSGETRDG